MSTENSYAGRWLTKQARRWTRLCLNRVYVRFSSRNLRTSALVIPECFFLNFWYKLSKPEKPPALFRSSLEFNPDLSDQSRSYPDLSSSIPKLSRSLEFNPDAIPISPSSIPKSYLVLSGSIPNYPDHSGSWRNEAPKIMMQESYEHLILSYF